MFWSPYKSGIYIAYIDVQTELQHENLNGFLHTDLYSSKAACLLKRILDDYNFNQNKNGILKAGHPSIFINHLNEVILYFEEYRWHGIDFQCKSNLLQKAKNVLKAQLKKYWNERLIKGQNEIPICLNDIGNIVVKDMIHNADRDYTIVTKQEYSCLYEFLNNKNKTDLQKKYDEQTYSNIIGTPIQDQFIISSFEVLQKEASNIIKEFTDIKSILMVECDAKKRELEKNLHQKYEDLDKQMSAKLAEVEEKMIELRKIAN